MSSNAPQLRALWVSLVLSFTANAMFTLASTKDRFTDFQGEALSRVLSEHRTESKESLLETRMMLAEITAKVSALSSAGPSEVRRELKEIKDILQSIDRRLERRNGA